MPRVRQEIKEPKVPLEPKVHKVQHRPEQQVLKDLPEPRDQQGHKALRAQQVLKEPKVSLARRVLQGQQVYRELVVLLAARAHKALRVQSAHKEQQVPKEFRGHWAQLV